MPLITPDRIRAGANIIRWNGWMTVPISIIRHSVAMHDCILRLEPTARLVARMALVHDLHETEIVGDVPTPDKRKYMNTQYHLDVAKFDDDIATEVGIPHSIDDASWVNNCVLKMADRVAVVVENGNYVMPVARDRNYPPFDSGSIWQSTMFECYEALRGTNDADEWWRCYDA
jgi:5'-deoxynucleotidase YfbR-like HD superfamily hydrolase